MPAKLDVGATLREVFATYREQAMVLLPVAFLLFLVSAVANTLAPGGFVLSVLPLIFSIFIATLYQGMVVSLVRDLRGGRRSSSIRGLVRSVLPVFWQLVGAGILAGIGIGFGSLLVLPGLYLMTIWAVIAPAIVIERREVLDAFRRSRQLVRNNGWHVFVVVVLVAGLLSFVVGLAFLLVAREVAHKPVLVIASGTLASTITAPIEALVAAVLYFRLLALQSEPAAAPAPPPPTEPPAPPPPSEPPPPPPPAA
ncbi:MAG TPA: hypothetical protein VFX44_10965 [Solirubrobacterales bacterium]|nr:hypothetical protein [Solirubrobacterales bacterium]